MKPLPRVDRSIHVATLGQDDIESLAHDQGIQSLIRVSEHGNEQPDRTSELTVDFGFELMSMPAVAPRASWPRQGRHTIKINGAVDLLAVRLETSPGLQCSDRNSAFNKRSKS